MDQAVPTPGPGQAGPLTDEELAEVLGAIDHMRRGLLLMAIGSPSLSALAALGPWVAIAGAILVTIGLVPYRRGVKALRVARRAPMGATLMGIGTRVRARCVPVHVPPPSGDERREILEIHMRGLELCTEEAARAGECRPDDMVDLDILAAATEGLTGRDLANLVNHAHSLARWRAAGGNVRVLLADAIWRPVAEDAVKPLKYVVTMRDFLESLKIVKGSNDRD